ncbi:polyprenyl synthetase family protein, partial [Pantoea sp. Ft+CA_17]
MEFESRDDVSIEEYINMIRLKTAVLLGGALKLGAIIAGASEKDADLIYQFGENIGIAFQLQDDIL